MIFYVLSVPALARRLGERANHAGTIGQTLFEGLAIHGNWNWSVRHPVVRLDFSSVRSISISSCKETV
ncbi:MAG: hypothetical protein OXU70_12495 [Gammaproteobacteria bacterium]|nr:hypothetical protein [Gammaproteobacteria bacterium]